MPCIYIPSSFSPRKPVKQNEKEQSEKLMEQIYFYKIIFYKKVHIPWAQEIGQDLGK